jgi:hypothetical protein
VYQNQNKTYLNEFMATTTQYDVQLEILNRLSLFSEDQLEILNRLSLFSEDQLEILSLLLGENKRSNISLDKIIDIISKYKIIEKEVPVEKIVEKIIEKKVPVEKIVEKEKIVYIPNANAKKQIIHLLDKICDLENELTFLKNTPADTLLDYRNYCNCRECKYRCN